MVMAGEQDFPPGHPARFDYNPSSPEAKEWARLHIHPKGERDYPVGHPKALDTPGNMNHVPIVAGIDPHHPDNEEFTGRSPEQAKAAREVYRQLSAQAKESPVPVPTIAVNPPKATHEQRAKVLDDGTSYTVYCPGCRDAHVYDSRWAFNGSLELPSFTPSYMIEGGSDNIRCHSIVTNGRITYLSDSNHQLSGQTVDLPPVSQLTETIHA